MERRFDHADMCSDRTEVEFRKELRERLGGDEGLPAVSNDTDNKLKVNAVETPGKEHTCLEFI